MAGGKPKPANGRMSWQAATLLIAGLSIAAWFSLALLMRWLSH